MTRSLTKRQLEVLRFIADFSGRNSYAPSVRDIMGALGFSSCNAVADHLAPLERKGMIRRTRNIARGTVITPEGHAYLAARSNPTV